MAQAQWYVVHAFSNFEKKVARAIQEQAEKKGLTHVFEQVVVPTQDVSETYRGKKRTVQRRYIPGYVLVKMVMSDEAYHLVKNTPKVTGFLGDGNVPMPVSDRDVENILGLTEVEATAAAPVIRFEIGEKVKVADGPFENFDGVVQGVDEARQRLKVTVSIFGRETPVDLEFSQVQKLD